MNEATADQEGAPKASPSSVSSSHKKQPLTHQQRVERWFEVSTAIMLAVVAVATAWSGYQATRWAGEQSTRYAEASALRVEATRESTLAGQWRLYDLNLVDNWINAHEAGDTELARRYERRFRSEFVPIFQAWLALDSFNNPNAPPGPLFMPEYPSSLSDKAEQLDAESVRIFREGQEAKEQGDAYVLNTVLLAMVLFLTAIADRFEWNSVRAVILVLALVLLLLGLYNLIAYPTA
jgi:hypothetical protein